MNKTAIEWTDFTWNPITGCLNHLNGMCKGGGFPCYAYKLANGRLKERYLANTNFVDAGHLLDVGRFAEDAGYRSIDPFYPRIWLERLPEPLSLKKPSKIFTVDMGELFGDWIPRGWQQQIFDVIELCPEHTFQLLTKQPQNLSAWSPFPENCWVGVTAMNFDTFGHALYYLGEIEAKVKYVSLEPYLDRIIGDSDSGFYNQECLASDLERSLDWLIIGAQTKPYKPPKIEWVQEIVEATDKCGIPIFLKDNLKPLLQNKQGWTPAWAISARESSGKEYLRQAFPK